MERLYLTEIFPLEGFEEGLKKFNKRDIINYTAILYKYYVIQEGKLDYTGLPDKMLRFLSGE